MNNTSVKVFLINLLLAVIVLAVPAKADSLPSEVLDYFVQLNDTLQTDTLSNDSVKGKKKDAIDSPVYYECVDSMVWSRNGNAYLYGSSKVNYDNIELTASIISMNMDSSVVHATGSVDTTGVVTGLPIFTEAVRSIMIISNLLQVSYQ